MTLKPGAKGFLHLGGNFGEPRWRQALILKTEDGWVRTVVRCSQEEVVESGLTSVECKGAQFCLVEAKLEQLRVGSPSPAMMLDVDNKELLAAGKTACESGDDLAYATASEPMFPKATAKEKNLETDSDSDSGEEAADQDIMASLRKSWLGSGMASGSKKREEKVTSGFSKKSKPFSLLESKKKSSSSLDQDEDKVTSAAVRTALETGDPLKGLLALQLTQSLKSKRKKKKNSRNRSSSSDSSAASNQSSSTSSGRSRGDRGHAKAVANYRRSGRRKFKRPLKHVKRFVRSIEEELGAQDRPFRLTDHNRRISFGKQQNLKRCHYLVCIILEWLLREEPHKAALQCVLSLQAMRQASIDNCWDVAWLLTHVEEPFRAKVFGGDPGALEHVTAYVKSMNELTKSTTNLRQKGNGKGEGEDQSGGGTANPGKSKGKGNKSQSKDKEKEKDKTFTEN